MLQVQATQLLASCNPHLRPYQCQPYAKSEFHAWPAVNADLAMADMLEQCIQKLDDEIATLQPKIDAAREKYGNARMEEEKKFKQILDQLVEKEKALISSRDKLLDKLPGALPGCAVGMDQGHCAGQMAYTAHGEDWRWWGLELVGNAVRDVQRSAQSIAHQSVRQHSALMQLIEPPHLPPRAHVCPAALLCTRSGRCRAAPTRCVWEWMGAGGCMLCGYSFCYTRGNQARMQDAACIWRSAHVWQSHTSPWEQVR